MFSIKDEWKSKWKILETGERGDFITIAVISFVLIVIVAFNIFFIFRMTSKQSEELGQMQMENIRSELQDTIENAERMTLRVAVRAEQLLSSGASQDEIKAFFLNEQHEQKILSNGECFNVYVAKNDWIVLPEGKLPDDYRATDRNWYKGAIQNPGKVFITEPYFDAAGHGLCFTLSTVLSDKSTVVALDFNFANTNKSIKKMDTGKDRTALIVTKDGMIIGYSDDDFIGETLKTRLPEYQRILGTILNANTRNSFKAEIEGRSKTVFFSKTLNGWYMILSVDDDSLYHDEYFHLMITSTISIIMIFAIVFFYFKGMKESLNAKKASHAKEEFLQGLSKELNTPLKDILKLSSMGASGNYESPTELSAKIREEALKLSEMINNLISFSTIVKGGHSELKKKSERNLRLYGLRKTPQLKVLAVLTIALFFRIGISIYTNMGWGDTKMNRSVETYEHCLSDWIVEQKTVLDMFSNFISEHPEVMNNYPEAVKFLNNIAKKYPEISVCYLANPKKEHRVIMSNGWQPPAEFSPETRQWYIDTKNSEEGFSISAPYYDMQTGFYCVTFAQKVIGKNEEFLGVFAIDFYLDRLIQILDDSYKDDGYAFLIDKNGKIINHPHGDYQMTTQKVVDVTATEYKKVYEQGEEFFMQDYSGHYMTCIAKKNEASGFTVVVADKWYNIYGQVINFTISFILIYIACVFLVINIINELLNLQKEVRKKLKDEAKKARSADQAKSQFLAQMSHEIRTPINAVLGMNEMIIRESNDEDIREYAENISTAGKTLLNLINSILDFSKIVERKMEIIPVRYDIINLIDDLVNMISEKANQKKLSLITKIDPNLPKTLYGDDMRIKQVITNILTNSVKYTNQGSITLTINGEFIDDDNLILYVAVEDTGIGIREEDIEKLFQSFTRLDETKNKNIEGTGLGISIVKELLKMMNSHLEVSSVYGKGSNFSFKLLQKIIDKSPIGIYGEHHADRRIQHSNKKFIRAPGARVLAVDDTNMNLKVIKGLLKRNLIVPDLAESGEKCLQFAAKYFYHIIFLDHMMPVMDGIETLKRLKKMNLPAETKIVVLTANATTGARKKYLMRGFDDYLGKPIDVDDLEAILAKYLPPDVVLNDDKPAQIESPKPEPPPIEEVKEVEEVDEDNFTAEERNRFESICPSIDLDTALSNCMNSKDFFKEMAEEFINSDKSDELETAFKAEDFNNYRIAAHGLKGTALVVGAVQLSKKAKVQELAANEEHFNDLKQNHEDFMTAYKTVREELSTWFAPEIEADNFTAEERNRFENICPSIDLDTALSNCMDSKDFFKEMAEEFINSDKSDELETALKAEDFNNYRIAAHGLKGTALVVGAVQLSKKAKAQELAANEERFNDLKQNHEDFMTTYKTVREELSTWFAPTEEVAEVKEVEEVDEDNFTAEERRRFENICPSIDLDTAISNCMDSKNFFKEMAEEFISRAKSNKLETAFKAEDFNSYRIIAHGLKGTALIVGAVQLSKKAKVQELAINEGRLDELKQNHEDFMTSYKTVCEELRNWRREA